MMMYTDRSRGRPFAKDPAVAELDNRIFLYYSIPPFGDGRENDGWRIGIATSRDLDHWKKISEVPPLSTYERQSPGGICAPGAMVLDGEIHLFYQTYGNGREDAICHATSYDGLHFTPNPTNPVFAPTGAWNCGRAIDADVINYDEKLFLYFSTRDPGMRIQMTGVATAPLDSDFSAEVWQQRGEGPILKPELPWEQECIEASALCKHQSRLFMFYGGAYNNRPQQIGCAVSDDGIAWTRISDRPILPNGDPGAWNSSESGHPFAFQASDGHDHLFFQGNNDDGATWYLSRKEIIWRDGLPHLT